MYQHARDEPRIKKIIILIEIDFIEVILLIKRCPKPCSTIPLIRKNKLNPFDYVPLATHRFEILRHQKRIILQNYSTNRRIQQCDVRLLSKKILKISNFLENKEREVRLSTNRTESNGLSLILRIRGIVEQGLQHLFINSNKSHFFHKNRFEQYLFFNMTFFNIY